MNIRGIDFDGFGKNCINQFNDRSVIFGFQLGTWFSVAMVGLAGAAILYDTSRVLRRYPEDRYVAAALQLFASVALMFWYVLQLFIAARD